MREYLDGNDLFNQVMLMRSNKKILVVEGESDYNLALDFLSEEAVEVTVGYGKRTLLEAGRLLPSTEDFVRFLVDADFDRILENDLYFGHPFIVTRLYDLYMDLHFQNADCSKRVARRYLKKSAITADEAVAIAEGIAEQLGLLRYVSVSKQYHLNLEGFPIHNFFPREVGGQLQLKETVEMSIQRTPNCVLSAAEILDAMESAIGEVSPNALINSHDFMSCLSLACRFHGNAKLGHKFDDLFELSVDKEVFDQTAVGQHINHWSSAA